MHNISNDTISHTITLGAINHLAITRITEHGLILRNHNGDQEILLPKAYVDMKKAILGDGMDVFVYTDSEDRPVATTLKPKAMLGEFGYFEVVDTNAYGAFVDWGLPKDLFVPLGHQKSHMRVGQSYVLCVALDEQSERLYGSQRIGRQLEQPKGLTPSQKLEALVIAKTPMGYKVIAENRYEGMLFANEIFEPITVGQKVTVYLKQVRSDGKLDCSLRPLGKQAKTGDAKNRVLEVLREKGGSLQLTSKSDPAKIEALLGISKKSFKSALTVLQNEEKIVLKDGGIELL